MLEWNKYISIANQYQYKARTEDRADLRENIILALARAYLKRNSNGHGCRPLTDKDMDSLASYECQKYWRSLKRRRSTISLNTVIINEDGEGSELINSLVDEHPVDLDARLDARRWLRHCPRRLLSIAGKILKGKPLTNKEHQYLWRFRHKYGALTGSGSPPLDDSGHAGPKGAATV